jgi:murein L,D-transpeptidase YafK
MNLTNWRKRLLGAGLAVAAAALLAGCDEDYSADGSGRSLQPIPQKVLALMDSMGSSQSAPIIFRAYKKEAEFEIWKQKSDGQYALLKTYPMCRWSGQLGPKKREGDRQVPEGFYTIGPGQMNPNSSYYLSFNVGYPNAFDRAWDRDGGSIMVHGICSSAGCFSMTDPQIAEIYAIAREAFNAGQRDIQFQSYPFRMTSENLAKQRLDPNIAFWKELKNGADHFEVTKAEVPVLVCDRHYVFGAKADGEYSARGACPKLIRDEDVEGQVAAKASQDDEQVAALVAKGVKPIRLLYADGGQNVEFAGKFDVSRPDALAMGPREIALDNKGKPIPAAVEVASADARAAAPAKGKASAKHAPAPAEATSVAAAPAAATSDGGPNLIGSVADGSKSLMKNLFKVGADTPPAVQVYEPESPVPADAPLPPRRAASLNAPLRVAALPDDARKSDATEAEAH